MAQNHTEAAARAQDADRPTTPLPSVVEAIGHTPLLTLRGPSAETGCRIVAKAEWMNPGMSVKDRAARAMVLDAEARGVLGPGGTIVEATAGNTGIGLALVGRARGYQVLIVIPRTQSQEKKDMLRLCGAELLEVDALPYSDPNHYVHIAARLAEERNARGEPSMPTSGTTWPTARLTSAARPQRSTNNSTGSCTASSRPSARAAPWPVAAATSRPSTPRSRSPWPTPMAPRCVPGSPAASWPST